MGVLLTLSGLPSLPAFPHPQPFPLFPVPSQHTLTLPQPLNQPSPHHKKHTVTLRQKLGGRKLGG